MKSCIDFRWHLARWLAPGEIIHLSPTVSGCTDLRLRGEQAWFVLGTEGARIVIRLDKSKVRLRTNTVDIAALGDASRRYIAGRRTGYVVGRVG